MAAGFSLLADRATQGFIYDATLSGSGGAQSTAIDVSQFEGPILITIDVRGSGTNTVAFAVTGSADNSTFAALTSGALVNPSTGATSTFSSVSTVATTQTLALIRDLAQRYIRVEMTGTTLTQNIAIAYVGLKKTSAV